MDEVRSKNGYKLISTNEDGKDILSWTILGTSTFEAHLLTSFGCKGDGCAFGEIALIKSDGKRNATVTCEEDTHLAVLSKDDYTRILQQHETKQTNELCQYLKNYEFIRNTTKQKMRKIGHSLIVKEYTGGNTVIKQGDDVNGFYLIKEGEFEW